MAKQCYMCDSARTSDEHVPPKCLFPEAKDRTDGRDLRKNLIKVPACELHNLRKSKDDEYLMYVLTSCHPINEIGHQQAASKLMRAVKRNPSLINRMLKDSAPAVIEDKSGLMETRAVFAEDNRLTRVFEMMGRALYFHHYGHKWSRKVKIVPEFVFYLDGEKSEQTNQAIAAIGAVADAVFQTAAVVGANPEVFRYWTLADAPNNPYLMRLAFYEHAKVTIYFVEGASPIQ